MRPIDHIAVSLGVWLEEACRVASGEVGRSLVEQRAVYHSRCIVIEAQARLDRELAAMTLWAQLGRFIDDLWADYQAELAADRLRLFALAQRRLNQRYERSRDQHRRDFATQMRAQGYAEVDGGAFGLVEPHGSLDLAESPE